MKMKMKPNHGAYTRYGMLWYWDKAAYGRKSYRSVVHLSDQCVVYEVRYVRKHFFGRWSGYWVATVEYMLMDGYDTCKAAMTACRDHLLKIRLEG